MTVCTYVLFLCLGAWKENPFTPVELVEAILGQFLVTKEDGGSLSMERRTVRVLHALLGNFTSMVNPVPVFVGITVFGVNR